MKVGIITGVAVLAASVAVVLHPRRVQLHTPRPHGVIDSALLRVAY
jgi:hypothetical protein